MDKLRLLGAVGLLALLVAAGLVTNGFLGRSTGAPAASSGMAMPMPTTPAVPRTVVLRGLGMA